MKLTGTVFQICTSFEEARQLAAEKNREFDTDLFIPCVNDKEFFVLIKEKIEE